MQLRNRRDLWAGIMFTFTGLLFIALSQQYPMGTAAKMGPGYFPTVLGGLMAVLGIIVLLGAYSKSNQITHVTQFMFRPTVMLLGGVALFAGLLNTMGMVVSLIALILISAVASHEFRLKDTLMSIVVLAIMAWVVFVWGLELQFPVWPIWFTK